MSFDFTQNKHVYLALGSNLGDKLENIKRVIALLSNKKVEVIAVSPIYTTPALLLKKSPDAWNIPHLNCVIKCNCDLEPIELLDVIKNVETELGRDFSKRWSPRIIDIDILFYKDKIINSERLTIPHKEILNRSFVLDPLSFIYEGKIDNYYYKTHQPLFEGIINITNNSFSNDGITDFKLFKEKFELFEKNLVPIIDIGAESTKPDASPLTQQEELSRLEPIFEYIRNRKFGLIKPLLSIDTYRPETAQLAIASGFDIVNDVSGLSNPKMLDLAKANKNIKFVFTHNYGLPANKKILEDADIIEEIDTWISEKTEIFNKYGIAKEQMIFDPGIGFGKTTSQSLQILQNLKNFHKYGFKILVGHSRKSFLKMFNDKKPEERDFETIAISMGIAENVDIIRVHTPIQHMSSHLACSHIHNQFV